MTRTAVAGLLVGLGACGGSPAAGGPDAGPVPPAESGPATPLDLDEAVLALPACEPSPWLDGEVPRLTAPFEGGGSEAVQAAGISILPRLRNRDELTDLLGREFLRIMVALDGVPAGTARFWLLVDTTGDVVALEVAERTDYALLDAAGSKVALRAKMTPAVRNGCTVPVWVRYPVSFERGRWPGGGSP